MFDQLQSNDEVLAGRIARRDIHALEEIYDRFSSRVFTLAAMLSDCEQAEQMLLQVFSRLWLDIDQFCLYGGAFQDWFMSLARAHILNWLVRNRGQTAQDRVEAIDRWLSERTGQAMKAGGELHQPDSSLPFWQALQDLTIEQRCVIVLAGTGGFNRMEIARLLSLPLSAVEQHIGQGLPRLRDSVTSELVLE